MSCVSHEHWCIPLDACLISRDLFYAGSNTTSVSEDNVLRIVMLMRNFLPAHQQIKDKKWDVPAVAGHAHDMMGMTIGTVGGGAIGFETMKRLRVRARMRHTTFHDIDVGYMLATTELSQMANLTNGQPCSVQHTRSSAG